MKQVVVPGTLSRCLRLGQAIRKARESGRDPVQSIVDLTGGWVLCEGEIEGQDWEDRDGYMYGTHHLRGSGPFEGRTMQVWFQNENHIAWLDGRPVATSPDLVTLVDLKSGEPRINCDIQAGDRVAVVGIKAVQALRTTRGIEALGPRHFGFDLEYVPIEQLVRTIH